jgi:uncharacterized protein YndB with AHSA1/START domain
VGGVTAAAPARSRRWSIPWVGEVQVVVDASPDQVFGVLTDVTRIAEWSHECQSAEWLGGANRAEVGATFRGRNQVNRFGWSRVCTVTQVETGRAFGYRTSGGVPSDSTAWSFRLEPVGAGTRITQRYEVIKFSRALELLTYAFVPAHRDRRPALREDLVRLGMTANSD